MPRSRRRRGKVLIGGKMCSVDLLGATYSEATTVRDFTVPIVAVSESRVFNNLGKSHTTRIAAMARIRIISIRVSLL